MVIEYGTGEARPHAVVRNQDLFLRLPIDPRRRDDRFASSFSGEDEITTALLRLKEGKKTKVGVHRRARRAVDSGLESARQRHWQLEGTFQQGRLRGRRPEPGERRDPAGARAA